VILLVVIPFSVHTVILIPNVGTLTQFKDIFSPYYALERLLELIGRNSGRGISAYFYSASGFFPCLDSRGYNIFKGLGYTQAIDLFELSLYKDQLYLPKPII
jgi:hypothetical protein